MIHLRTDLPLIPDREMEDWIEDILENTHFRDIHALRLKLDEAIRSNDSDMTHASISKKCDKCDRVYPEFINKCECGNNTLSNFEVHYNIE